MLDAGNSRWDPVSQFELPQPLGAYVDGAWVDTGTADTLSVEDPATEAEIATVRESTVDVVAQAVESAYRAFRTEWGQATGVQRGRTLARIAAAIRAEADQLATLETVDTGKPLRQARADVETSARYFEYYAGLADKIVGSTLPAEDGTWAYTLREPYGVVAHLTPWNSPLSQMCRGVAPSLAAGNSVVVKPSELTPLSSLVAARIFVSAGLPPGVCNVIPGRGTVTGSALMSHPRVAHVSFTGSLATGRMILHLAAERIVGCNLELGGKSPTLVLADADLSAAAHAGAMAVARNSGQSCFATTRLIVHHSVADDFIARLCDEVRRLRIGHGLDDLDLGPLASADQMAKVQGYLDSARSDGANVAVGGGRPEALRRGHFMVPAVLTRVTNDMRVAREEIFGPVQTVLTFDDEEEAVAFANDSDYGLAAGIYTNNLAAAHRIARRLQVGQVQVNRYPVGRVDTPFGGYKQSGLGRERGAEALLHYTQLKTVIVQQ